MQRSCSGLISGAVPVKYFNLYTLRALAESCYDNVQACKSVLQCTELHVLGTTFGSWFQPALQQQ